MEFKPVNIDELVAAYRRTPSTRALAVEFNLSAPTIRKKLRKAGIRILSSTEYVTNYKTEHRTKSAPKSQLTPELLKQWWGKVPLTTICQKTGATSSKVKRLAKKLCLPDYVLPKPRPIDYWWDTHEWLHKHYETQCLSLNDLSRITGSEVNTVRSALLRHNIQVRNVKESVAVRNAKPETKLIRSQAARKIYPKAKAALDAGRDQYNRTYSLAYKPGIDRGWFANEYETKNAAEIARDLNVNPVTIKYWLVKWGLYDPDKIRRWTDSCVASARLKSLQLWADNRDRLAVRTALQKRKISDSVKDFFSNQTNILSIERWKAKISLAARRLWQDEQYRAKAKHHTSGRFIDYSPLKSRHSTVLLRSTLECAYAIMLDLDEDVITWDYEISTVNYDLDGKTRTYIIDFTVQRDGTTEYIEVKPEKLMLMHTKHHVASRELPTWRFNTALEITTATKMFKEGYRSKAVEFRNHWPKSGNTAHIWCKEIGETPAGWVLDKQRKFGIFYALRYRRNVTLPMSTS